MYNTRRPHSEIYNPPLPSVTISGTLRTGSNLLTLPGECAEIII